MATAVKTQKDFQFTLELQSTWSTARDSAPLLLLTEDMPISIEPNNHNVNVARGIRGSHESDNWNDLVGVIPTAQCNFYVVPETMEQVLPAMLQKATDWTAAASVWTMFTVDTCSAWPNPAENNDGYFYTLTRRACQSTSSVRIDNAVPTNLTFRLSETDNEGVLFCESEWIGQHYTSSVQPTGTVTNQTLTDAYSFADVGEFSYGAYDMTDNLESIEISLTNGARYVRDLPTGPIVFNGWEVSGSFTVAADTNTETLKGLCQSMNPSDARTLTLEFGDGTVNAAGEANLTVFCYLNSFTEDFTEGHTVTFSYRGVFGTVASNEFPFRAVFYNA